MSRVAQSSAGRSSVSISGGDVNVDLHDGSGNPVSSTSGALDVNIVSGGGSSGTPKNFYNEVASVASGITTLIGTYTVPSATNFFLQRVDVSGDNIAEFLIQINSSDSAKKRTYFGGNLNATFEFTSFELATGTILEIFVTHFRPSLGTFESRIQGTEQ